MNYCRTWLIPLALVAWALPVRSAPGQDTPAPGKMVTVRGQIAEVQTDRNQLTLRTRNGQELRLYLESGSQLQLEDRPAKLSQFKAGARVQVTYVEQTPGKHRVVRLREVPTTTANLKREVTEALAAARAYAFQQKDEYQGKLESVLQLVDDRIEDLQDRAEDASAEAKKELAQEIEELRKKKEAVRGRLAKVKSASADAWEDIKTGVGAALEDLQKAYERAWSRFR